MTDVESMVHSLTGPDNNLAYRNLKILVELSQKSDQVFHFFDNFVSMISSPNSYVRTRGLLLVAANARWDTDYKIDEIIDEYLTHIMDEKPTVSRQLIPVLPDLAEWKPELKMCIRDALLKANPGIYKDTMEPLVRKDIQVALNLIKLNAAGKD